MTENGAGKGKWSLSNFNIQWGRGWGGIIFCKHFTLVFMTRKRFSIINYESESQKSH